MSVKRPRLGVQGESQVEAWLTLPVGGRLQATKPTASCNGVVFVLPVKGSSWSRHRKRLSKRLRCVWLCAGETNASCA